MEPIKVRKKYQITLPTAIREAAGIYEGDFLIAKVQEDRTILLHPSRLMDADEAFFCAPEWQAAEREADEDIRLGRPHRFDKAADAVDFLHDHDQDAIAPESCPPPGAA
jgi:AbrB family looped-hinge helix DNA binding protein